VAITAPDYRATALTPTAPAPEPGETPDQPLDPDRVGVVFVDGIGTQQPAETFLEWSAPIVRMLTAWRIEHGFPADPVVRSEFSFIGSSQHYLELDIPASGQFPARRWVLTEAWWAAQIRAPSLGAAAAYVRRGLPGILRGITNGYKVRTDPVVTLISGLLDFLAGGGDYPDWIASFGDWLIGVLVVGLVFWAIAIVGGRLRASWDERERTMVRLERMVPIHRRDVGFVSALLFALTVALSADALQLLWG